MPYPLFPPLSFSLPELSFPLHGLKIKYLPIRLHHEYYSDLFENDFLVITPECFLLFACIVVLLYGVIYSRAPNKVPFLGVLGVCTSWLGVYSIICSILLLANSPISGASIFYSYFVYDSGAFFFKMLVLVGSLFCIIISLQYIQRFSLNAFEVQAIILISSVSMLLLISCADFISIYLAIELQSLCFYVMAGMKRDSEFSTEAGLKYFLLGAFSSGILLFGLSLQYGFTGTTHFSQLAQIFGSVNELSFGDIGLSAYSEQGISSLRGCELGMIFIFVAFLFKLSAAPLHMWAPDVYEGAPTSVTAFFAIVPKVSLLAVCLRLCYGAFYEGMISWQKILILSCILSMVLGAFAAFSQNKIKRLLAWSSIGHVGYLLTAVGCGTIEGVEVVFFYLVIYIVMTISLFQLLLSPMRREKIYSGDAFNDLSLPSQSTQSLPLKNPSELGLSKANDIGHTSDRELASSNDNQQIKYTLDLAFAAKTNPIIAICISITMFSIAGIPPLAGFYSKAFLLFATMSVKQYLVASIVILTSVISCFYYIRIVKIMYFEKDRPTRSTAKTALKGGGRITPLTFMPISKASSLVFSITFAVLVFFCLAATPLFTAAHAMAFSFSHV